MLNCLLSIKSSSICGRFACRPTIYTYIYMLYNIYIYYTTHVVFNMYCIDDFVEHLQLRFHFKDTMYIWLIIFDLFKCVGIYRFITDSLSPKTNSEFIPENRHPKKGHLFPTITIFAGYVLVFGSAFLNVFYFCSKINISGLPEGSKGQECKLQNRSNET